LINLATKRVVVTGGAGFLGGFVCDQLRERGCEPVVVRSRDYDLREVAGVEAMYADLKPEILIHLAAVVGGIGANRDNPGRFLYENLVMGTELIERGRRFGALEKFVAVGTICAYPKFTPVPFREADLWNGYPEETNAPYGLAKKMMLAQIQAYEQQYDFPGVFLLPVNLYGPRDNFDLETSHVIPALIRKMDAASRAGERRVTLWGDGSPTREFIHAGDAARGIVLAAERYTSTAPVNIGAGREISIKELAELIRERTGFEGEIEWDTSKPNGQPRRALEVSRARERFGFEAEISLEDGLSETVEWWRDGVASKRDEVALKRSEGRS
jgi:GDP-L-fucose synthase